MPHQSEAGDGKVLGTNMHGQPILARRDKRKITEAEKRAFLDHLAECCNGEASAQAAGRRYAAFYRIRRRDPQFDADWRDALQAGHAAIEALMIERAHIALLAKKTGGPDETDEPSAASIAGAEYALSMDSDQILRLLAHNQRTVSGGRRGGNTPRPAASEEEACAAILKKLKQLRKRIDAKKE